MDFSSRSLSGPADLFAIARFFDEARELVGHGGSFLHAGDLWWRWGQQEPEQHQFRLYFRAEQLIGFGWVLAGESFEIHLHPTLGDDAYETIARDIVAWAKTVCPKDILGESIPQNTRLIKVLESCGFERDDDEFLVYAFDLRQDIPDAELPDGFQARHVLEHEHAERVSVHRDAFDPSKFTPERYARVRSMPGYNPELDLVVSTPEHTFASYCIVWLSNGAGLFEPVGARAAHRRQGLGRAVILEGFRRLKALGASTALVGSQPKNRAFYESCGFRVMNQFAGYVFKGETREPLEPSPA